MFFSTILTLQKFCAEIGKSTRATKNQLNVALLRLPFSPFRLTWCVGLPFPRIPPLPHRQGDRATAASAYLRPFAPLVVRLGGPSAPNIEVLGHSAEQIKRGGEHCRFRARCRAKADKVLQGKRRKKKRGKTDSRKKRRWAQAKGGRGGGSKKSVELDWSFTFLRASCAWIETCTRVLRGNRDGHAVDW